MHPSVANVSRGERRDPGGQELPVLSLLIGIGMTPELHEEIALEDLAHGQRQDWIAHDAEESFGMLPQVISRDTAVGLWVGRVPSGEQTTQITVARAILGQEQDPTACRGWIALAPGLSLPVQGDARSDQSPQAMLFRSLMKTRCSVDTVGVGEDERSVAELGCTLDQVLRERGPFEEAEGTSHPELDIGGMRHGFSL